MHEALNTFESPEMHESLWADAANMAPVANVKNGTILTSHVPLKLMNKKLIVDIAIRYIKKAIVPMQLEVNYLI